MRCVRPTPHTPGWGAWGRGTLGGLSCCGAHDAGWRVLAQQWCLTRSGGGAQRLQRCYPRLSVFLSVCLSVFNLKLLPQLPPADAPAPPCPAPPCPAAPPPLLRLAPAAPRLPCLLTRPHKAWGCVLSSCCWRALPHTALVGPRRSRLLPSRLRHFPRAVQHLPRATSHATLAARSPSRV